MITLNCLPYLHQNPNKPGAQLRNNSFSNQNDEYTNALVPSSSARSARLGSSALVTCTYVSICSPTWSTNNNKSIFICLYRRLYKLPSLRYVIAPALGFTIGIWRQYGKGKKYLLSIN